MLHHGRDTPKSQNVAESVRSRHTFLIENRIFNKEEKQALKHRRERIFGARQGALRDVTFGQIDDFERLFYTTYTKIFKNRM